MTSTSAQAISRQIQKPGHIHAAIVSVQSIACILPVMGISAHHSVLLGGPHKASLTNCLLRRGADWSVNFGLRRPCE